ncbi:hypothetical protein [Pelagibacterium montanilacus]|uniref:hypothetical protein n=1 Tax=Pelagibacterium montanilacus TaxID=2185280 RepID=UPI000F8DF73E|nr:hypothetical protein [Pelagibacterium montanilacus]
MAEIDREDIRREPQDVRSEPIERERIYNISNGSGGAAGWWLAGAVTLAALIGAFIFFSGGDPTPTEAETVVMEPAAEPAPAPEPAPAAEPAPAEAAPAEAAPVEPAPVEAEPAPAEAEVVAPVAPAE